ncbi:sensor histidine kinase [Algibacillus agarilyticus]|uniref:sensor histidine kinase n=1 Tax=Algibacillus agarilyticus TaxID=2234133 RepID=UPI000DCFCDFD|nr:HAMP domain-containing sensor histidine kinase [Algibacillus agarilyticus]
MHNVIKKVKQTLFWKIFLLVWLSYLAIALSAALIFTLDFEQEKFHKKHERHIERLVLPHLLKYEDSGKITRRQNGFKRQVTIQKLPNKEYIFGKKSESNDKRTNQFILTTPSDNQYQISYRIPQFQHEFMRSISVHFSPMRVIFSVIILSLFSLLITEMVTRPIQKLREHVSTLSSGDLNSRVATKITKRNDDIGLLARTLNKMSARISQLINDKQQLLYDVSHELKAPLARMQVANAITHQAAEQKKLPVKHYQQIDSDISLLTKMIDQLLSLARIEHSEYDHELQTIDLHQLLQQEIQNCQYNWPNREIELQGDNLKLTIASRLLCTVINNILINALKYTNGEIQVLTTTNNNNLMIKIIDAGEGIPETLIDNLFTPFVRGKNQSSGYGLGLAISQKAIRQLHGSISAKNLKPTGLAIEINLPLN